MSISFECLDKYLDALHGRISNKDPKVHAEVLAVRQYFHLHWNDDRISNSLRQAILEKIKRVLELPERYLDVEEVPSLYDLTGLNDSEVKPEVWPVKVPRTFLDQALQSLVRRIEKTAACVESEEEVQRSEFYRDWATYPSWAQVECVGYTLSRIQRVWDVKDALWRDGVKRINRGSESARRIGNACPKLEVYVKIVQNQDPISFHQALLKLSSLSSPSNEDPTNPFRPDPRSFTHTASHTSPRSRSPRSRTRSRSPPRQSGSPPQQSRIRSPFRAKARSNIDENRADSQRSPRIESPSPNRAISPVHDSTHSEPVEQATPKSESEREEWESWLNFD